MGASPLDDCWGVELPTFVDPRGGLTFGQTPDHIPFEVKRFYALHGVPEDSNRGAHAHRDLRQLFVVFGRCTLRLDDGISSREHVLDSPRTAIHVGSMVWRDVFDFAPGSVCLVLASELYDEADYIRDYDAYLAARGLA